jgi:hypothetical protein
VANTEQSCGQTITDNYTELSLGGLRAKEKQLTLLSVRQQFQQAASQNSPRSSIASSIRGFFSFLTVPTASNNAQLPQHQTAVPNASNATAKSCTLQTQSGQHNHHFIHWCIPWSRYATRMSHLQSCQIYSDLDFFRALKKRYLQSKRHYQSLMSFKKPVALRFVKFRLYHRQLVDIHETNDIPPESQKHEYEYSPMPKRFLPSGQTCSCNSSYIQMSVRRTLSSFQAYRKRRMTDLNLARSKAAVSAGASMSLLASMN